MGIKFRKDTRTNLASATPDDETIILLTDEGNKGLAIGTGSLGGLIIGESSGAVDATGTPADGQLAVWTDANTLEGDAALTFDTTTDTLYVGGTLELGHASDTTLARSGAGVVTIEGVEVVTTSGTQTLTNKTVGAATLSGTLDGDGQEIARNLTRVVAVDNSSTGVTLTAGDHSGCVITTNGTNTITVPTTAGFNCVIKAGAAHTVTFNSTASAAMASGDLMTLFVESSTVIHAVLTAAANKVTFSA